MSFFVRTKIHTFQPKIVTQGTGKNKHDFLECKKYVNHALILSL